MAAYPTETSIFGDRKSNSHNPQMIPDISHLQFAVLGILLDGERSGREVRARLAKEGAKKTLAAFYQLMARIEESKWVKGWYETRVVDGQTIKERRYRITPKGSAAWERVRDFYSIALLRGGAVEAG